MTNQSGFKLAVTAGLNAHFLQPNGPSRAGTDWAVTVTDDGNDVRILVRTYADTMPGLTKEQQTQRAIEYVALLLSSGWTPADYQGRPGELTVGVPPSLQTQSPEDRSGQRPA